MTTFLRIAFHLLFIRPLMLVVLGLNVRHRERLPKSGPAVIVANHNSHLDTFALVSLFPLRMLGSIRPVAAADYFLRNRFMAWFFTEVMNIIPMRRERVSARHDPLATCVEALEAGKILILFPEGSRGEPEQRAEFKKGVAHLAKRCPEVPFVPLFLHGAGKVLPRGEGVLVPFFVDVFVGESMHWHGDRDEYMKELNQRIDALAAEGQFAPWE